MRRVAAIEPKRSGVFPHHTIDRIGVHASALVAALAIVLERPEQWPVDVGAMPGGVEIGAKPRRGLRVDRQRIAPAALARHPQ